jgi:hypothetical protein
MGAVGFLFLQLELSPSIQLNPETVTVRFGSKRFMNVLSGFVGVQDCAMLGVGWIRFNLWLTGMLFLAAQTAGVAKPGQRRSPEAAVP